MAEQVIKMELPTKEHIDKFNLMIKGIPVCMLTSKSLHDNHLHSRPMATQDEVFDGKSLHFFTNKSSLKVSEIQNDHRVNLAFIDNNKHVYVSVCGIADLMERNTESLALMKSLITPNVKVWFPKGVDDPEIALIKVVVYGIEFWSETEGKMVKLFHQIQSTLKGETYQPPLAENVKIDLSQNLPPEQRTKASMI